jgi:hypothetical protein
MNPLAVSMVAGNTEIVNYWPESPTTALELESLTSSCAALKLVRYIDDVMIMSMFSLL